MYVRVDPWFCAPVRSTPVRIINFGTTLVLVHGYRNQIRHPSGNLARKRHNPPPVSFGKASSAELVLDSSLGHRDRAVRVKVFIMLDFVVAIPLC